MMPGTALYRLAGRICSVRVMQRLIDPIVADIQKEHAEAIGDRHPWRAVWTLVAGSIALARALALYGTERLFLVEADARPGERRAMARAMGWAVVLTMGVTALLLVPPLLELRSRGHLRFFYLAALIPQALPLWGPNELTLSELE